MNYFVHDRAIVDSAEIGEATRIWAFSHVLEGAKIGSHCNLGEHVFVEGNVHIGNRCTIKNGVALWDQITLEDGVFVGPYAVFTNDLRPRAFLSQPFLPTHIRKGASIGANATIVCGNTIGEFAMIGSGAVVTSDVPAHALVLGNPGKVVGYVCFCGKRLSKWPEQPNCGECELSHNGGNVNIEKNT